LLLVLPHPIRRYSPLSASADADTLNAASTYPKAFAQFDVAFNRLFRLTAAHPPVQLFLRNENVIIEDRLERFKDNVLRTSFILQGAPGSGKTKQSLLWLLDRVPTDETQHVAWVCLLPGVGAAALAFFLRGSAENRSFLVCEEHVTYDPGSLVALMVAKNCSLAVFANCNAVNGAFPETCEDEGRKIIRVSALEIQPVCNVTTIETYVVNGWTLEEYQQACADDKFYDSVKHNLRTDEYSAAELDDRILRDDVVAAKYHVAGANARWMLEVSMDVLLDPKGWENCSIQCLAPRAVRLKELRRGFNWYRWDFSTNHLLSRIQGEVVFVSRYVACLLATTHHEALVECAKQLAGANYGMQETLQRMEFIARLGRDRKQQGLPIMLYNRAFPAEAVQVFTSGPSTQFYRLSTFCVAKITLVEGMWFVPEVVNSAGFDCVQWADGGLKFVQVARLAKQSFNLKWFESFRARFAAKFAVSPRWCRVYFVVPQAEVTAFTPPPAQGALQDYTGPPEVVAISQMVA
jgi:hypothetical protein